MIQRKSVELYVPGPLNILVPIGKTNEQTKTQLFSELPPPPHPHPPPPHTHTHSTVLIQWPLLLGIHNRERIKARQSREVFVLERILIHQKAVTTEVLNNDK